MTNLSVSSPSVSALRRAFPHLAHGQATEIKRIMQGAGKVNGQTRLERIDLILGTHGVEHIPAGHNSRSPAIHYCNTGDTYGVTILKVNGKFRIGCWGDIVERGNYD